MSINNSASVTGKRIEYAGVYKAYGKVTALHPTNLTIEPSEFLAIIGPSGSGKTTLLGLTAGFVTPSGGHLLVDGKRVEGVPPFKRNIGMVFQNYSLFLHKTVAQNIAFPLQMRGVSKHEIAARVTAALALVRLSDFADRYPSAMSGGQQQRVALARATVYNPSLLVMDEPLSALDKNLREEMQFEIKRLQAQLGCTVLYVTHDQAEAAAMADRIAVMRNGKIVQTGSAQSLYQAPIDGFVAAFVGAANMVDVQEIEHAEGHMFVQTPEGRFRASPLPSPLNAASSVCIRAEAMRISSTRLAACNSIEGILEDVVFLNGIQRHRVRTTGGRIFEQCSFGAEPVLQKLIGSRVFLQWSASDMQIIPRG